MNIYIYVCMNVCMQQLIYTHTHFHGYGYIYIYIYTTNLQTHAKKKYIYNN